MRLSLRRMLILLIGLVLIVSLALYINQLFDYKKGVQAYQDAQNTAGIQDLTTDKQMPVQLPEESEKTEDTADDLPSNESDTPSVEEPIPEPNDHELALLDVDLSALQKINSQVKGWIAIPDTNISYPLTQGTDNDYYLKHTWNFEWSSAGSIFLEHMVSPDFTDFNTLIYGHRMNNGTMFSGLKQYKSLEFWEEHPEVYIRTNAGVSCYRVYAAYEAKIDAVTYGLELNSEELRTYFIEYGLAKSVIDTGIVPTVDDSVITLVTCTGRGHAARWVVQAVLDHTIPAGEITP